MEVVSEQEVQQHSLAFFVVPERGCSQASMQNTAEAKQKKISSLVHMEGVHHFLLDIFVWLMTGS